MLPNKGKSASVSIFHSCIVDDLLNKYSNLNKICRIITYCLRLFKAHRAYVVSDFVSLSEISAAAFAERCNNEFYRKYQALIKSEIVNASNNILSLFFFLRWKRTNASWREVEKFESRVQCMPPNPPATQTHINSAYYRAWTHMKFTREFASHDGFRAPAFLSAIVAIRARTNTKMYNLF